MMQHFITTLGIVGSIASVIGLLLPANGWRTKVIHVTYGLVIAILGIGVTYYQSKLAESTRIENQAKYLRETREEARHSQVSLNYNDRGFILAALTFFERYRSNFPETYERAKQFSEKSGVLIPIKDGNYTERDNREDNLREGAEALDALLYGVASGAMN